MCDDCTQEAYEQGAETAGYLTNVLQEIADLHTTKSNYCVTCLEAWPCETFLTAVGAINDVW